MRPDDLVWMAQLCTYTARALLYAGEWRQVMEVGNALVTAFPSAALAAEAPLAPAPTPPAPQPPAVELDDDMLDAAEPEPSWPEKIMAARAETDSRLATPVAPVGAIAAEDAVAAALPLVAYAARQLHSHAAARVAKAEGIMSMFVQEYEAQVAEITKVKKRKKATVAAQKRRLAALAAAHNEVSVCRGWFGADMCSAHTWGCCFYCCSSTGENAPWKHSRPTRAGGKGLSAAPGGCRDAHLGAPP